MLSSTNNSSSLAAIINGFVHRGGKRERKHPRRPQDELPMSGKRLRLSWQKNLTISCINQRSKLEGPVVYFCCTDNTPCCLASLVHCIIQYNYEVMCSNQVALCLSTRIRRERIARLLRVIPFLWTKRIEETLTPHHLMSKLEQLGWWLMWIRKIAMADMTSTPAKWWVGQRRLMRV